MNGKAVSIEKNSEYTYKDENGVTWKALKETEELETTGIRGKYKYTENMLREEQELNKRIKY